MVHGDTKSVNDPAWIHASDVEIEEPPAMASQIISNKSGTCVISMARRSSVLTVERQIAISTRPMSSSARPQFRDINLTLYLWDDHTHPSPGVFATKNQKLPKSGLPCAVFARIMSYTHSTLTTRTRCQRVGSLTARCVRKRPTRVRSSSGRCSGRVAANSTGQTRQDDRRQYFMQALFAAPLCSVHPWRSPNCKTRAG